MLEPAPAPRPHPRKSVLVEQGDVTIETYVEGEGPTIVLLPSSGRDGAEDFDEVASRLANVGHRVLRPQPRGIAGSKGPMQGTTLQDLAADVAAAIVRLGNGRAIVVGHAFGHFVARMTAVDHPEAVRGVVLAAAAAKTWAPDIAATPYIAGNPAAPEHDRLAALRLGFFAPGHDPRPWLKGWYPETQRMQKASREQPGIAASAWWTAGTAPLLELIPAMDPFKPREKWAELREAFGDRVATVVIENASHALFPEQPAAVAQAIAAWATRLPA